VQIEVSRRAEQNFFYGSEIYFRGTKIYFKGFEIYFRAIEKVLWHASKEK